VAALVLAGTLAAAALAASTDFAEPASSPEAGGNSPSGVAAADFDLDGDLDLATANSGSDDVTILRNNGVGNFAQPASSPEAAGDGSIAVAAADLDGDGDPDLAVANQTEDSVTILRNDGGSDFIEPGSSPEATGDAPRFVGVCDQDGDGDQDLAIANDGSDDVTILRNNGAGNFSERGTSPEAAGDAPQSVALSDQDGDADLDLAITNFNSDNVTILRNNGAGNFSERGTSPEAVGNGPAGIREGDFDGDTDLDLAVANVFGDSVTILRNNGAGNFIEPGSSPESAGDGAGFVAGADLEFDGDVDLLIGNRISDDVTVLGNNAAANFAEVATSPEAAGDPRSIVLGDLDGDLDPDAAVANGVTGDVTILDNL
jgi:hypothetical protein